MPILTKIINSSLTNGIFPRSLKLPVIRPLLKEANIDGKVLKNYRPVANIPYKAKLIKHTVKKHNDAHLALHGLLSNFSQHIGRTIVLRLH